MRRIFPFYVIIFVGFIGYSIQIPIFTSLFLSTTETFLGTDSLALRKTLLGLLLSVYPIGQFLGAPILGAISDKVGRRPVLLFSLIFATLLYSVISITITFFSFWWLYLLLFICGFFEGNIALSQGGITDVIEDKHRSKYFGYNYVFGSTAYIVGPVLSSFFSNQKIIPWFGPATTFWVVTLIMLATTIWIFLSFQETHTPEDRDEKVNYFQEFSNLGRVFNDEKLRYYYGVNFLIYIAIFGFFRSYSMYLVEIFQLDLAKLSLMVAYVSLPMILMNIFIIPFFSRFLTAKTWTMLSSFAMGIFMILIVFFPYMPAIWFTLFITTSAIAIAMTFSASNISFLAERSRQGAVMGNNQSLVSLAESISASFAGVLAALFVWLPLATLGLFGIAASILLMKKQN